MLYCQPAELKKAHYFSAQQKNCPLIPPITGTDKDKGVLVTGNRVTMMLTEEG